MFGFPLKVLKVREQSDIPLLINNLIIRLLPCKIDYTKSLSQSEDKQLEELKRKINQGSPVNLTVYPDNVCVKLLKYFNLCLNYNDLFSPTSINLHRSIYYLVNKTSTGTDGIREAFISLYPLQYFSDIKAIYDNLSADSKPTSADVEKRFYSRPEFFTHLEVKDLQIPKRLKDLRFFSSTSPKKRRILTIDGGGMRGLIAIKILSHLAIELYGDNGVSGTKSLIDNFDLIGGTSSGSIIAMALVTGHTLEQIRSLFYQLGRKVFINTWSAFPSNLYNYYRTGDYYSHQTLIDSIESLIKDKKINEITTKVFVTSTLATTNLYELALFKSYLNPASPYFSGSSSSKISEVLRASSAAPTYFSPYIDVEGNKFKDGGLIANNPTEAAIFEGYTLFPEDSIDLIVSIGTGKLKPIRSKDSIDETVSDLLNIVTSSDLIHLRVLEWLRDSKNPAEYFRFSPEDLGSIKLDTTDVNILENCEIITNRYMVAEKEQVKRIKEILQ